jgi:hypothetical protein
VTVDQTYKPAEYAAAGISLYRLDPTTGVYATAGVPTGRQMEES